MLILNKKLKNTPEFFKKTRAKINKREGIRKVSIVNRKKELLLILNSTSSPILKSPLALIISLPWPALQKKSLQPTQPPSLSKLNTNLSPSLATTFALFLSIFNFGKASRLLFYLPLKIKEVDFDKYSF